MKLINIFKEFELPIPKWQEYAEDFIAFINGISTFYLYVLLGIVLIFLLHYLIIGPKSFPKGDKKILFYSSITRSFHWVCAIFFTFLIKSGLIILFAKLFAGGELVRLARSIHIFCAYGFIVFVTPLFFVWLKDMFPASYDIKWLLMFGGYLSKKSIPVPAGKFNFGQKIWFWLATVGGAVMFYTGFYLQHLNRTQEELVLFLKIHLVLGLFILALFITHLYMSLFAVKGSLKSMLKGYKDISEVKSLHSKMPL